MNDYPILNISNKVDYKELCDVIETYITTEKRVHDDMIIGYYNFIIDKDIDNPKVLVYDTIRSKKFKDHELLERINTQKTTINIRLKLVSPKNCYYGNILENHCACFPFIKSNTLIQIDDLVGLYKRLGMKKRNILKDLDETMKLQMKNRKHHANQTSGSGREVMDNQSQELVTMKQLESNLRMNNTDQVLGSDFSINDGEVETPKKKRKHHANQASGSSINGREVIEDLQSQEELLVTGTPLNSDSEDSHPDDSSESINHTYVKPQMKGNFITIATPDSPKDKKSTKSSSSKKSRDKVNIALEGYNGELAFLYHIMEKHYPQKPYPSYIHTYHKNPKDHKDFIIDSINYEVKTTIEDQFYISKAEIDQLDELYLVRVTDDVRIYSATDQLKQKLENASVHIQGLLDEGFTLESPRIRQSFIKTDWKRRGIYSVEYLKQVFTTTNLGYQYYDPTNTNEEYRAKFFDSIIKFMNGPKPFDINDN